MRFNDALATGARVDVSGSGFIDLNGFNQSIGSISGTGTISAPSVTAGGPVAPGNSPGQLTLTGDLTATKLPSTNSWQQRPDYLLAQTRTKAAQTEAELAKAKRWQDMNAGFFAAREQQDVTPRNTERTGFVGFRFSIPLPLWNRNQGEIAEKAASAERARLEKDALASQITSEADTARREMEANAENAMQDKQKELQNKLKAAQDRLAELTQSRDSSKDLRLSTAQEEEEKQFRAEVTDANKQIRELYKDLKREKDKLSARIIGLNLGVVPGLVLLAGIGVALFRRLSARAR